MLFMKGSFNSWDSFFMIAVIAFPNSWDNFFMIAVTAFLNRWDNLFRTAMTADPAAWILLIFPHLAKTKTNYWNYLFPAKIPSFSTTLSLHDALPIFTIFNLHISHTSIYHTYYKYYIPQNIYVFYHLHASQEISNTYTKSPSHGRHEFLLLKSFS